MIRVKKDKLEQLNLDNGTTNLLEYLYENKNKDNIFVVKTKSQLSKDYGLSLSTINKRLKVLQDNNIIKLTTKRGKNGGTIISFLVEPTETHRKWEQKGTNIIESESQYAQKVREQVYPKYIRPLGNGRPRRTKQEMIELKLAKNEKEKTHIEMNRLTQETYPQHHVFEMSQDPVGYFRAYILAKLYDVLAFEYTNAYYEYYTMNDTATGWSNHYQKESTKYSNSDILGTNYFGKKVFTMFYNLQAKLKELDLPIHDFNYIQSVFNNFIYQYHSRKFYKDKGHPFKQPIPYVNYLYSGVAIEYFSDYISNLKMYRNQQNSSRSLDSMIKKAGTHTPTYQALKMLYDSELVVDKYDFDKLFVDALEISGMFNFEQSTWDTTDNEQMVKNMTVFKHYQHMVKVFTEKVDSKNDLNKLLLVLRQLHVLVANPTRYTNLERISLFGVQTNAIVNDMLDLEQNDRLNHLGFLGGFGYINVENYGKQIEKGIANARTFLNTNMKSVILMYRDYREMTINYNEFHFLLKKYNLLGTIPFDKFGLLRYDKIQDTVGEG